MVESPDFTDPVHGIPVYSLYGAVRRPTAGMMASFDVPAGRSAGPRLPRVHLHHHAALCARGGRRHRKALWVLDRPNPIGRGIEGTAARRWESFVGAGRCRCVTA